MDKRKLQKIVINIIVWIVVIALAIIFASTAC